MNGRTKSNREEWEYNWIWIILIQIDAKNGTEIFRIGHRKVNLVLISADV